MLAPLLIVAQLSCDYVVSESLGRGEGRVRDRVGFLPAKTENHSKSPGLSPIDFPTVLCALLERQHQQ